jgi:hypothetical protein
VQKYFASIGLKYTPADKSDKTYRSVPVSEATIGKRRWVFDNETDMWLCPIEKPSVMKTLTIGIESKELTRQEHDEACLESAVIELSQYGREEFDRIVLVLKGVFPEFKFHTYDYYITKQMDSSEGITPWIPKAYKIECDDFVPTSHFRPIVHNLFDIQQREFERTVKCMRRDFFERDLPWLSWFKLLCKFYGMAGWIMIVPLIVQSVITNFTCNVHICTFITIAILAPFFEETAKSFYGPYKWLFSFGLGLYETFAFCNPMNVIGHTMWAPYSFPVRLLIHCCLNALLYVSTADHQFTHWPETHPCNITGRD